jgi:hypothetical protein
MPFEDIIGTEFGADIFGGAEDIFGADVALGGYDHDLASLLSAGAAFPIVGNGCPPQAVHPAVAQLARVKHAAAMQQYANSQRQQNKDAFVRTLAARHSAAVMPRPITKGREYPLGFPATVLAAGQVASIVTQPQVPFRGRRLIVPSDIAGAILINDLKVGKNSMFASASGPVPARGFTEFGVGVDLNLDTAQISQQISLNVQNVSGASVTFTAMLIGTAVE